MSKAVCRRTNRTTNLSLSGGPLPKFKTTQTALVMAAGLLCAYATKATALETGLPLPQLTLTSLAISTALALGLAFLSIRYFKIKRRYKGVLQKNQRKASALLAASDSTWYWDLKSDHVTFSPSLQTTLNDGTQSAPRNSRVWAYLLHPDDLKPTYQLMQEAQTHCLTQFQQACRLKNNQGKYLSCIVSGSACNINRKGQPLALAGTILFSSEKTLAPFASAADHTPLADSATKTPSREPQQTPYFLPDKKRLQSHLSAPSSQQTKQLLIVDDDPFIRQMLSSLLADMKTHVILVSSGEEALDTLGKHHIDLVLMDLEMPEMNGSSTLTLIRSMQGYESLPVISMTAGRLGKHLDGIAHSDFNEEISKPIDPQKLKRILNHYLEEKNQVNAKKEEIEKQDETTKIMDLDIAMYYVEGNRELLAALLTNIHDDHYHDLEKFRDYQKNNNAHDAQRLLHTLKGIAGTIGATELETSCENLESQQPYQEDDLDKFEQNFLTLMKEIEINNGREHIKNIK